MLNHPMLFVGHLYTIIFRDFLKSHWSPQNIQWWPFAEIIDAVQSFEIESTNDKNATSVLYILTLSFNLKWFFLKTFFFTIYGFIWHCREMHPGNEGVIFRKDDKQKTFICW